MKSRANGRNGSRAAGSGVGWMTQMAGRVQQALEAAAFAEEGDPAGARSLMRESRRVLLALRGLEEETRTMTYALNTCRRIGAGLDLLCVTDRPIADGELQSALAPFLASCAEAGIPCRTASGAGCIKEQIIRYTTAHPEVSFVVVESAGVLDGGCGADDERRLSRLWKRLACPLVVVSDPARATQAADNGPSAALRSPLLTAAATRPPHSSGFRKPCIWTIFGNLRVLSLPEPVKQQS